MTQIGITFVWESIISSDIANYCYKHNAMILTNDSDFLFYDLKGVIILDLVNIQNETVFVFQRKLLLQQFKLSELQLFYFAARHGNDFIKHTRNQNEWIDIGETLRHISRNCNTISDCKKDFKNQWNYELTNELDVVYANYSIKQVEYPISLLTLDLGKVNEVKYSVGGLLYVRLLISR